MSMTTTSASCLSATPRATVAPTLPAPPTTVTLRFIQRSSRDQPQRPQKSQKKFFLCVLSDLRGLLTSHMLDERITELRSFELGRAVHQACEVVGHALGRNRA